MLQDNHKPLWLCFSSKWDVGRGLTENRSLITEKIQSGDQLVLWVLLNMVLGTIHTSLRSPGQLFGLRKLWTIGPIAFLQQSEVTQALAFKGLCPSLKPYITPAASMLHFGKPRMDTLCYSTLTLRYILYVNPNIFLYGSLGSDRLL